MACRSEIGGHSATGEIPRHFTAQITLLIVETITKCFGKRRRCPNSCCDSTPLLCQGLQAINTPRRTPVLCTSLTYLPVTVASFLDSWRFYTWNCPDLHQNTHGQCK
ncbi:hypothetical protein HZH66_004087 [Vespula vulgaris]|uniref:Uncharacterized protein n=1 Tax=Vespula vulgaris TaxID=7454 RepID=A0A834KJG5_VESVU|nr:hypothetical protein HZH66_004087 [Vespula vulgaris]